MLVWITTPVRFQIVQSASTGRVVGLVWLGKTLLFILQFESWSKMNYLRISLGNAMKSSEWLGMSDESDPESGSSEL